VSRKRSPLGELITYLLVAPLMDIIRLLPKKISYTFFSFLCRIVWSFGKRRRRIAIENLKSVYPDISDEKADNIGLQSLISMVFMYVEFCWMGSMRRETVDDFVTFEGWDNLEKAFNEGKGVMLTSMHIYNGELVSAAVSAKGMPVNWVIREVDNRYLDKKMDKIRRATGLKIVKKEKAMHRMIKALKAGELLAFTADQKASMNGVWVNFLGRVSSTVKSPAVLHLRTGTPIVPIFSYPTGDGKHNAYILPALKFKPTGDKKLDIFIITQMIADLQSEFIHKHPEIWLWMHRRWSVVPSGKDEKNVALLLEKAKEAGMKRDLSGIR